MRLAAGQRAAHQLRAPTGGREPSANADTILQNSKEKQSELGLSSRRSRSRPGSCRAGSRRKAPGAGPALGRSFANSRQLTLLPGNKMVAMVAPGPRDRNRLLRWGLCTARMESQPPSLQLLSLSPALSVSSLLAILSIGIFPLLLPGRLGSQRIGLCTLSRPHEFVAKRFDLSSCS